MAMRTLQSSPYLSSSAPKRSSSRARSASASASSSSSFSLPNIPLIPPEPSKSVLHKHPLYAPTQSNLPLQIKEKIICLEILGIDSGKALAHNPSLHSATLDSVESIITFLRTKGIQQKDLKKIFGMCPKILTSDIAGDLIPVFEFLTQDLGVPFHRLRKVVNKCPRLLASSAREQLKPALFFLQRLGFRDAEGLAENDAVLLVSSVEKTLIPKLRFLESLGVSKEEAVGMVVRCPTLFTFSIDNNLKPKFEYLVAEMGRKVEEVREFPHYFAFSLEKRIKPRHLEIVRTGFDREMALPLMLISTDHQFTQLINPLPTPND